jgi:hypothetical protein
MHEIENLLKFEANSVKFDDFLKVFTGGYISVALLMENRLGLLFPYVIFPAMEVGSAWYS